MPHSGSRVTLSFVQHGLVRSAVRGMARFGLVTPEQRRSVRDLCDQSGSVREPEQFLIAFKVALIEAANDERIPYGPERNDMLGRLVTVFIDELYKGNTGVDDIRDSLGKPTIPPTRGFSLENDSPASLL